MTKIVIKLDTILDALEDALVERLMSRLATEGASAPKETYTPEELAARYGMSKSSINRRIRAGGVRRDDQHRPAHPPGHGGRPAAV